MAPRMARSERLFRPAFGMPDNLMPAACGCNPRRWNATLVLRDPRTARAPRENEWGPPRATAKGPTLGPAGTDRWSLLPHRPQRPLAIRAGEWSVDKGSPPCRWVGDERGLRKYKC